MFNRPEKEDAAFIELCLNPSSREDAIASRSRDRRFWFGATVLVVALWAVIGFFVGFDYEYLYAGPLLIVSGALRYVHLTSDLRLLKLTDRIVPSGPVRHAEAA